MSRSQNQAGIAIGAAAAAIGLAATGGAVAGFLAKLAASVAVSQLANGLLASRSKTGRSDDLLGLPVGNTDPGAPTVWAIGRRVRVPLQTLWMTRRVVDSGTSVKGKTGASVRQTYCDVAFRVNDRPTQRLVQLIANDSLLSWTDRNIYTVRTSSMSAAESGGQVTLTMDSTDDPDFALTFEAADYVELSGFVATSGPSLNSGYWEVISVTGHTGTPSSMVLEPRTGQTVAGLSSNAGTPAAPATIARVDDARFSDAWTFAAYGTTIGMWVRGTPENGAFDDVFRAGDTVRLVINGATVMSGTLLLVRATEVIITGTPSIPGSSGSSSQPAYLEFVAGSQTAQGYFPNGFVLSEHFYTGTDTQDEDATIVAAEGAGNVGGFRGMAYQVIDDFNVTNFGGIIPPMMEALVDIDPAMTWASALVDVAERGGLLRSQIDVSGVADRQFEGMYLRGPVQGIQAMQQLLLAGQIATQDRGGVLACFSIDNADVVQVQNGAVFTDFAADVNAPTEKKWSFAIADQDDYPTTIGVRHQDPDYGYGPGYAQFGIRNPNAADGQNVEEIDLSNLVLTPKDARNLAATVARRAIVNGTRVSFQLPASYSHVLENDLLTFTDDNDVDHTVRVVRADIGTNLVLRVDAVVERVGLSVSGSPVQGTAGTTPNLPRQTASILGVVFDAPPVDDAYGVTPGIHVAACATSGTWGGCTVHASTDSGQNWSLLGTLQLDHAIGTTSEIFEAGTPSETLGTTTITWDDSAQLTVEFDGLGQLPFSSVTDQDVINGWQWFAILDTAGQVLEVVGARDVVQNTATNYTFSRLLRGLRGTFDGAASDVAAGARVVGVSPSGFALSGAWFPLIGISYPSQVAVKFVPAGGALGDVEAVGIGTTWRNVQPFPIRDVTKTYDVATDVVRFTIDHWTRKNLAPGTVGPYPHDESYETYRVTLYHQSGNGQAIYVRTVTAVGTGLSTLRDPWVEFTDAEQTAAGYTPSGSETYWVGVEQIGDYATSRITIQEL